MVLHRNVLDSHYVAPIRVRIMFVFRTRTKGYRTLMQTHAELLYFESGLL